MTPLERNRLLSILNTNGFHAEVPAVGEWVGAEATFAPGRCYAKPGERIGGYLIGTTIAEVAQALIREGYREDRTVEQPDDAVQIYFVDAESMANRLVRRIYQLSRALPTAPLDTFKAQTRGLPATTEAERLVIQRVGQDIFRDALLEYWSGRCAVTAIDQPELLRASHCKPWSVATDAERLDVHNGLLLVADVDAAFDCGLLCFDDSGAAIPSDQLGAAARARFGDLRIVAPTLLTAAHRLFLRWHRDNHFRK